MERLDSLRHVLPLLQLLLHRLELGLGPRERLEALALRSLHLRQPRPQRSLLPLLLLQPGRGAPCAAALGRGSLEGGGSLLSRGAPVGLCVRSLLARRQKRREHVSGLARKPCIVLAKIGRIDQSPAALLRGERAHLGLPGSVVEPGPGLVQSEIVLSSRGRSLLLQSASVGRRRVERAPSALVGHSANALSADIGTPHKNLARLRYRSIEAIIV